MQKTATLHNTLDMSIKLVHPHHTANSDQTQAYRQTELLDSPCQEMPGSLHHLLHLQRQLRFVLYHHLLHLLTSYNQVICSVNILTVILPVNHSRLCWQHSLDHSKLLNPVKDKVVFCLV